MLCRSVYGLPRTIHGMRHPRVFDGIVVECDRCRRPVAELVEYADGLGDRVVLQGPRIGDRGAEQSPYWRSILDGPEARSYMPDTQGPFAGRTGGVILDAPNGQDDFSGRSKIRCTGRKHPRHEVTVTGVAITTTYHRAVAAGLSRIGMREIRA